MKYRYLIVSPLMVYGKHELSKEYFVIAVQRGDTVIDTEENTVFDKDSNSWQSVKGDDE